MHSHDACLEEVKSADYLVLIIGKRRGGGYIGSERSITNEEYKLAEKLKIPTFVLLLKSVSDHRPTFKINPTADYSHIVEDTRIFAFIDSISLHHTNNWIHVFEGIHDIREILTTQFSQCLLKYSQALRKPIKTPSKSKPTCVPFPSKLSRITDHLDNEDESEDLERGLRGLHEILRKIILQDTNQGAKNEQLKQLWLLGKYGEYNGDYLTMLADQFKPMAWGPTKGKAVNNQLKFFGIRSDTDQRILDDEWEIRLSFDKDSETSPITWALGEYVKHLDNDSEDGMDKFFTADMRLYS